MSKEPKKEGKENEKEQGIIISKALVANFVALQKVQANLTEKLDNLTNQISELLRLFESTAKTFAENPAVLTSERDKEFLDKINQLLEQDKIIAKGVVYIEDRINEVERTLMPHHEEVINQEIGKEYTENAYPTDNSQVPKPLPRA